MSLINGASIQKATEQEETKSLKRRREHGAEHVELDKRPLTIKVWQSDGCMRLHTDDNFSPTPQTHLQHLEYSRPSAFCLARTYLSHIWTRRVREADYFLHIFTYWKVD
jgi:hypothetical protein